MPTIVQDLRFSFRVLRRYPAVSLTTIGMLALGIGATATVFSIAASVLRSPLPFPDAQRLVMLWEARPEQEDGFRVASSSAVVAWANEIDEVADFAATVHWQPILSSDGHLRSLDGAKVTADFLRVLAVEPALGRFFSSTDDEADSATVVLSHSLWVREFGADPRIIGREIALEGTGSGTRATVIGVLPPEVSSVEPLLSGAPEIFAPLTLKSGEADFGKRYLRVLARLADGSRVEEARAHLTALSTRLSQQFPQSNTGWTGKIDRASEQIVAPVRPSLGALSLAVAFVFLIACCNVGILQLSQATVRRQEIAVRLALGAGPRSIVRQVLSDCLLLTLLSGALGWVLFHRGLDLVTTYFSEPTMQHLSATPNYRMFGLGLFGAFMTLVLFSLYPTLKTASCNSLRELQQSVRGATGRRGADRRGSRLRRLLVRAEIAMSLVLLIAATLMIRSFQRLTEVETGFRAAGVTTARLRVPQSLRTEDLERDTPYRTLQMAISSDPRIQATSWVNHLPMDGVSMMTLAAPAGAPSETTRVEFRGVGPQYFRTLGIPLLEGNDFEPPIDSESAKEVILSASAARRLWPGHSAIGQQILLDWGDGTASEVIGVVGDVKHQSISGASQPTAYLPYTLVPRSSLTLIFRSRTSQTEALDVKTLVNRLDPTFVVDRVSSLENLVEESIAAPRSRAVLTTALALMALFLAAGGTYSVVAYSVAQQRYDFCVRQALGARPKQLIASTVGEGLRKAAFGIVLGLLVAALVTRAISGLLYGVSSHDPWTWVGTTLLMAGMIAAANYLPARRAMKGDPARDLR